MTFPTPRDRRPNEPVPLGGGRPDPKAHLRPLPDVLDVVAVVSNPVCYRARYDLFRAFERHVLDAGARLTVVEMAFGRRPFEVTRADEPRHVQVRSGHVYQLVDHGEARSILLRDGIRAYFRSRNEDGIEA